MYVFVLFGVPFVLLVLLFWCFNVVFFVGLLVMCVFGACCIVYVFSACLCLLRLFVALLLCVCACVLGCID